MRWPTKDLLLACHDCGVLLPVEPTEAAEQAGAAPEDNDYLTFVAVHATHRTGHLLRQGEETLSDQPLWDPMGTLAFPATDGEQPYVVIARRESIEEARTYRFTSGILECRNSEVLVDDSDLRRGLDRQFFPYALRPTKLDLFISVVHDIISHIPADALEIAFDAADDPAISVARMPTESYQELLTRCTEIFDPWEWPRVSRFLRDNRGEDGLLALRVRRQANLLSA